MRRRGRFIAIDVTLAAIVAAVLIASFALSRSGRTLSREQDTDLLVVTSFYPMYIVAQNVIGDTDGVQLENLSDSETTGCLHDYQLTTEDMELLSTADIFIINGGGIESFLTEVAEQYPDLTIIDASEGITLIDDNPHVWMSMENYKQQVQNVYDGMLAADPDTSRDKDYEKNINRYMRALNNIIGAEGTVAGEVGGQPVVLLHEAFVYLAEEIDLDVVGVMDLDGERQISAGELADLISIIEEEQVQVIFAEDEYGTEIGDTIAQETGAQVVYLDPLTRGDGAIDSYLAGIAEDLSAIETAYLGEDE